MPIERVDETYETKMAGFEVDCADGKGEPSACHYVAEFYGAVREEYSRAAALLAKNLVGKGVDQNDNKALELFEKGCKGGLLPSCYFQAILLYSGLKPPGTVIDPDTFNSALKDKGTQMSAAVKSAQPGVPITPAEVAQQKKNRALAMTIFDKNCTQGDSDSCFFLGSQLLKLQNPDRDPKRGEACLKRACDDSNHGPSCFNLAVLYKNGDKDKGFAPQPELSEKYQAKTIELAELMGGMRGTRTN